MGCSLPGSSVHGIFQARVLEWGAIAFSNPNPNLFQQHKRRLHMDITRWSILKSDWLYSLQPKIEKLYTVSKNKTGSWLWLRSWTQQTWVWVNSGSWCWTGRPVVLRFMGSQRVRHDWVTKLIWNERLLLFILIIFNQSEYQYSKWESLKIIHKRSDCSWSLCSPSCLICLLF